MVSFKPTSIREVLPIRRIPRIKIKGDPLLRAEWSSFNSWSLLKRSSRRSLGLSSNSIELLPQKLTSTLEVKCIIFTSSARDGDVYASTGLLIILRL